MARSRSPRAKSQDLRLYTLTFSFVSNGLEEDIKLLLDYFVILQNGILWLEVCQLLKGVGVARSRKKQLLISQ